MIEPVVLERLGETVDEVVVLEWYVSVGDEVAAGDPLLRVETDKVEVDVPAPVTGTVVECFATDGDEVATGAILCTIEARDV